MTIDDFKTWFLETLKDGPIKSTEIPVKLVQDNTYVQPDQLKSIGIDMDVMFAAVNDLIKIGLVIEIEYSNPNTDFRRKSMYFHGEAKIKMIGNLAFVK